MYRKKKRKEKKRNEKKRKGKEKGWNDHTRLGAGCT